MVKITIGWSRRTPLVRLVVDLLYNKLYNKMHNKSTTKGQTALRYPGRRPGRRPGFRPCRFPTSSCESTTSSRLFGLKAGRRQVRAISTRRDSSNLVADRFAAGFRPAFDRPATRTWHAHAGLRPGRRPGLRLDSVMEFGLNRISGVQPHWSNRLFLLPNTSSAGNDVTTVCSGCPSCAETQCIRYDTMHYIYLRPKADKASLICRTEPNKNSNEEKLKQKT